MRFRPTIAFALSALILAACGGPVTVDYRLTFDTEDPATVEALSAATVRVAQRRMERLDATVELESVSKDAEGTTLTLNISSSSAADVLTAEMTAPFTFDVMQATDSPTPDVAVEGMGGFQKTDVGGDDVMFVLSRESANGEGAQVGIRFTEEGLAQMRAVMAANVGKDIGIFVNGRLVSAMRVQDADLPETLVIDGIPDIELAQIFADDVNVGLHVTVTPN